MTRSWISPQGTMMCSGAYSELSAANWSMAPDMASAMRPWPKPVQISTRVWAPAGMPRITSAAAPPRLDSLARLIPAALPPIILSRSRRLICFFCSDISILLFQQSAYSKIFRICLFHLLILAGRLTLMCMKCNLSSVACQVQPVKELRGFVSTAGFEPATN